MAFCLKIKLTWWQVKCNKTCCHSLSVKLWSVNRHSTWGTMYRAFYHSLELLKNYSGNKMAVDLMTDCRFDLLTGIAMKAGDSYTSYLVSENWDLKYKKTLWTMWLTYCSNINRCTKPNMEQHPVLSWSSKADSAFDL